MVRSPILDVAPSFCLPPVDRCTGVKPSQAAKSRPLRNVSTGGARAAMAVAVIGPTPGIVINREGISSSLARLAAVGDQRLGLWQGIEHEPCALVIAHLAFGKHHHQWLASVVADEVQF
jgi:hypothetical protein